MYFTSSNGINFGSQLFVLVPTDSPSGSPGLSGKNFRIKSACKTVFSRSSWMKRSWDIICGIWIVSGMMILIKRGNGVEYCLSSLSLELLSWLPRLLRKSRSMTFSNWAIDILAAHCRANICISDSSESSTSKNDVWTSDWLFSSAQITFFLLTFFTPGSLKLLFITGSKIIKWQTIEQIFSIQWQTFTNFFRFRTHNRLKIITSYWFIINICWRRCLSLVIRSILINTHICIFQWWWLLNFIWFQSFMFFILTKRKFSFSLL